MEKFALLGLLKAKPGKENEVEAFLKSAVKLAQAETFTQRWYAVKFSPDRFGIFDTFPDPAGQDAHLSGEIAKLLMAKASELLAEPPRIEKLEILAAKTPEA